VSYSDIARGAGLIGHTAPTSESTQATTTEKTQETATVAESVENSLGSRPTSKQPEGAISGLSNLKRKMDKIDQERELFKAENAKLEDEVSSVTNSLSKLGDEILAIRQDMTKLSSTLREELAEFKNIFLSMSEKKNAPSPRRKAHRRSQNSDSASASSNDETMLDTDTSSTDKHKVTPYDRVPKTASWDSMCEYSENIDSRKERRIRKNQSIYRGSSQDVRMQDSQPPSTSMPKPARAY
jgi:chromosome segregation ATPase